MESEISAVRERLASLRRARNWAGALDVARQLAELDPSEGENWFWVARALEETRDLPGALAAYEQALRVHFADEELRRAAETGRDRVRVPLAEAERKRREKVLAHKRREQAFRTVAELSSFTAVLDAARRAREGHDLEIALAAADRALELADDHEKRMIALTVHGATLRRAGRVSDAIEALREAISINDSPTENHQAYTALVAALREAGEYRLAVECAEKVLRERPNDAYMLWAAVALFTAIYREDNRPSALERAQEYAQRAARVAPEQGEARALEALAHALERHGASERAAEVRGLLELLRQPSR